MLQLLSATHSLHYLLYSEFKAPHTDNQAHDWWVDLNRTYFYSPHTILWENGDSVKPKKSVGKSSFQQEAAHISQEFLKANTQVCTCMRVCCVQKAQLHPTSASGNQSGDGRQRLNSFTACVSHPAHHTTQILVYSPRERMNQDHPGAQESRTASFSLKYLKLQVKTLSIFNWNLSLKIFRLALSFTVQRSSPSSGSNFSRFSSAPCSTQLDTARAKCSYDLRKPKSHKSLFILANLQRHDGNFQRLPLRLLWTGPQIEEKQMETKTSWFWTYLQTALNPSSS